MLRRVLRHVLFVVLLVALVLQGGVAFAANVQTEVFPLERNGIQLHLARYQTDDGGGKKPLLMVHGLTYSSHEFDVDYGDYSLVRFFANNGYSVWLLDIAGYGSSQKVEDGFLPNSDYAAEDIAAAAKLITTTSKTAKLDVLGWSWGTVTGGRFAAKYPDLVGKLVLYAPIVAGLGVYEVPDAYHSNDWLHAAGDFQVKADNSIDYDIVEPIVVDTFLSNCWRYDGAGSPNGGRRDLLVASTERLIPTANIKAPTLLIVGDKDPYVSVALCEEAKKTLANGELKVIEGAAHAAMMEKPYYKEFRESVLEFLKK
ncbi:MAG: alpha/beta hydrolase [Synergistaceae bacterium]|jgi:pimeloyl-ACP methyl ester carboxylesterase|nr:alpha/beta hydrolase [Synergistaceae bacterium]